MPVPNCGLRVTGSKRGHFIGGRAAGPAPPVRRWDSAVPQMGLEISRPPTHCPPSPRPTIPSDSRIHHFKAPDSPDVAASSAIRAPTVARSDRRSKDWWPAQQMPPNNNSRNNWYGSGIVTGDGNKHASFTFAHRPHLRTRFPLLNGAGNEQRSVEITDEVPITLVQEA